MQVEHSILVNAPAERIFGIYEDIPLFRMVFDHGLLPHGSGVRVVHRVVFSGLLSPILGRVLVRQLNQGLPVTLDRLKRLAESGG